MVVYDVAFKSLLFLSHREATIVSAYSCEHNYRHVHSHGDETDPERAALLATLHKLLQNSQLAGGRVRLD